MCLVWQLLPHTRDVCVSDKRDRERESAGSHGHHGFRSVGRIRLGTGQTWTSPWTVAVPGQTRFQLPKAPRLKAGRLIPSNGTPACSQLAHRLLAGCPQPVVCLCLPCDSGAVPCLRFADVVGQHPHLSQAYRASPAGDSFADRFVAMLHSPTFSTIHAPPNAKVLSGCRTRRHCCCRHFLWLRHR